MKTRIWIAVSICFLVAIVWKRLWLEASLYEILPMFSVTVFEKVPILRVPQAPDPQDDLPYFGDQLVLFDF